VGATEWSLTTDTSGPDSDTTNGVYQVILDVSDMIAGDVLVIRLYEKARSADTQRLAEQWTLAGAQATALFVMPTICLGHGWDVTVQATSGTITVLWSIRTAGTWTEFQSGTEAVAATEWSATTDTAGPDSDTTAGCYQLVADLSDMVAGDDLRIRIYEKARSGDTQRVVYESIYVGAQSRPLFIAPALLLLHGWDATFYAAAGTVTVNWSLRKAG